jgi:glycine hydroxymethyltransferase
MRSKGLDGARVELLTNEINIFLNKNTVPGDKSALTPSAIRVGSPAMTTRGLK